MGPQRQTGGAVVGQHLFGRRHAAANEGRRVEGGRVQIANCKLSIGLMVRQFAICNLHFAICNFPISLLRLPPSPSPFSLLVEQRQFLLILPEGLPQSRAAVECREPNTPALASRVIAARLSPVRRAKSSTERNGPSRRASSIRSTCAADAPKSTLKPRRRERGEGGGERGEGEHPGSHALRGNPLDRRSASAGGCPGRWRHPHDAERREQCVPTRSVGTRQFLHLPSLRFPPSPLSPLLSPLSSNVQSHSEKFTSTGSTSTPCSRALRTSWAGA